MNVASNKRLSVLISAHEVSPILGSECSSGWNVLTRLGKYHDLIVMHAETNQFRTNDYKSEIEKACDNSINKSVRFVSISQPKITLLIAAVNKLLSPKKTNVGIPPLYFLGVYFWERAVLKKAKCLMKTTHFDLVHHFNHLSYREPGLLYKTGKPFVWGPVSGVFLLPITFLANRPLGFRIKFLIRNILCLLRNNLSLRLRQAIRSSSLILAVTAADKLFFEAKGCLNIRPSLDVGAKIFSESAGTIISRNDSINNSILRVLWVGRLDYLKSLDILLNALGGDPNLFSRVHLTVVGDGELLQYYKVFADKMGIQNISWAGSVSNEEVFGFMKMADVLVHTSVKEAGSAVVLEALSAGLPVICHDAFGFSYTITETCGLKVPFINPQNSILGFKAALWRCLNEPKLLHFLKLGAKERARNLSWDYIAECIANDYSKIALDNSVMLNTEKENN